MFGGARGMRDEGLLDSALARPVNKYRYDRVEGLAELAAAYGFGVAQNQAFVDGNKTRRILVDRLVSRDQRRDCRPTGSTRSGRFWR